ncbi:MAG TPA: hypothetical protein VII50_08665 [Acidothermaceae bacterium]
MTTHADSDGALAAGRADAHTIVDSVIDAALAHCGGELADAAALAILAT